MRSERALRAMASTGRLNAPAARTARSYTVSRPAAASIRLSPTSPELIDSLCTARHLIVTLCRARPRCRAGRHAARARRRSLGFTASRASTQQQLERTFDAALKAENLRAWLKQLAARPHHVGSPYGKANAEFMAGLFRSWGYDTAIEEYQVLFPTPTMRIVELVAPTKFVGVADRAAAQGGRDLGPGRRAAAGLQRLLDRRRRHRRAGLRQLGRARRLRRARTARHRRARQDRHRALRRIVARHQAEGRGRARRDRLPDLLGSARGRLSSRATSIRPAAGAATAARSAARSPTCRPIPAIR